METFLEDSYAGSEDLAPGTPPSLVILTTSNTSDTGGGAFSGASQPPLQPFTSPFFGQSIADAAQHPVLQDTRFFAILDERSARDSTALLAARDPNGSVRTVRAIFLEVQRMLITLDVGCIEFSEIQANATTRCSEGVYGVPLPGQPGPRRGGPAPRKKLGT